MVQTHVTYAMLGVFILPWIRDRFFKLEMLNLHGFECQATQTNDC